jgi:hypothetical protein
MNIEKGSGHEYILTDVRVDGEEWVRVPTFARSAGNDPHYVLRRDDDGRSLITFGDGTHGRIPPVGSTISATYSRGSDQITVKLERSAAMPTADQPLWTVIRSSTGAIEIGHDDSQATVGWSAWGTGTVGITKGETLSLCTVNVGSSPSVVLCGIYQNPRLIQDSFTLQPGESKCCQLPADDIAKELFDDNSRVQVRAFIKTSTRTIKANLEVFNNRTKRTSIVLPLEELEG